MRRTAVTSIIMIALMILASCATNVAEEPQGPVVDTREYTDRQDVVAVSLPEVETAVETEEPEVPVPESLVAVPMDIVELDYEETFEEAVPIALEVSIIEEPVETPEPEVEKEAPKPLGEMVYAVNLAGEESLIPQSLLQKEEKPSQYIETFDIVPEEKVEEIVVDEIKPEDLVPYDVTVSAPEPWYKNILAFLSAYGVWIAILFAIFAVVVVLIVIVVKRPSESSRNEIVEEPSVVDEGPMEDETASQEASFDPEIERQRSMERIGENSDDDYNPVQSFTGDDGEDEE